MDEGLGKKLQKRAGPGVRGGLRSGVKMAWRGHRRWCGDCGAGPASTLGLEIRDGVGHLSLAWSSHS